MRLMPCHASHADLRVARNHPDGALVAEADDAAQLLERGREVALRIEEQHLREAHGHLAQRRHARRRVDGAQIKQLDQLVDAARDELRRSEQLRADLDGLGELVLRQAQLRLRDEQHTANNLSPRAHAFWFAGVAPG